MTTELEKKSKIFFEIETSMNSQKHHKQKVESSKQHTICIQSPLESGSYQNSMV